MFVYWAWQTWYMIEHVIKIWFWLTVLSCFLLWIPDVIIFVFCLTTHNKVHVTPVQEKKFVKLSLNPYRLKRCQYYALIEPSQCREVLKSPTVCEIPNWWDLKIIRYHIYNLTFFSYYKIKLYKWLSFICPLGLTRPDIKLIKYTVP